MGDNSPPPPQRGLKSSSRIVISQAKFYFPKFQLFIAVWFEQYLLLKNLYLIIKIQVLNCYKVKRDVLLGAKSPTPKPKDIRAKQSQTTSYPGDTIEETVVAAAYKVADERCNT